MIPFWLMVIAWFSLSASVLGAAAIAIDEFRRPQTMWVMNLVWPLTSLYAPVIGVWAYFAFGRTAGGDDDARGAGGDVNWKQIAVSTSHCGAGCALADMIGENIVFAGHWSLLGQMLYAEYAVTLALAWTLGIAFQYFAIKPMKQLSTGEALVASAKADTLSIVFFQVGMYGWMAVVYFVLLAHPHLEPRSAVFWLMMQIGMMLGYVTAWPVNVWLLRRGFKKAM
jgi:hypothetical protein